MATAKVEKPVNVEMDLEKVKDGVRAKARIDGQEEAREKMISELANVLNKCKSANHALAYALYSLIAPPKEYSVEEEAKLNAFNSAIGEIDAQLADKTLLALLRKPLEDTRQALVRDKANYEAQLRHVESSEIDTIVGQWAKDNHVGIYMRDGALFRKGNVEAKMDKAVISDKGVDAPDAFDMAVEKYQLERAGKPIELKSLLELSSAHCLMVGHWVIVRLGSKAYCATRLTSLDGEWRDSMFMTYSRDGINHTALFPRWSLIRRLLLDDGYNDGVYYAISDGALRQDIARALWKLYKIDIAR